MKGQTRLVIHVGPHKTGSTYIQKGLEINAAALGAAGIFHPTEAALGERFNRIVTQLRWAKAPGRVAGIFEPVVEACRGHPTVLLSSENFAHADPVGLARFRDLLDPAEVVIVYYIRDLVGLWPSSWQEQVKHGSDVTFAEYLRDAGGSAEAPRHVPQRAQIRRFAEVFGRETLRLFVYDNLVTAGRDIFQGFLADVLDLDPAGFETPPRAINRSFAPVRVEMLRCLNMRRRADVGDPRRVGAKLRQAYMRDVRAIEAGAAFARFRDAFRSFSTEVTVAPDHPFIRLNEAALLEAFGDRVVDLPAPGRLFAREAAPRSVRAGSRFWHHAAGVTGAVEEIHAGLSG